jgi:hypothetical protein
VAFEDLGDILLQIDGSIAGLVEALGEATAAIDAFAEIAEHTMHNAGKDAGRKFGDGVKEEVAKHDFATILGQALKKLSTIGSSVGGGLLGGLGKLFMPAMWTTLIYGASQAAVALAPAIGALGLIPAAAFGAATSLATLKIAMTGVGDAVKQGMAGNLPGYVEAMKKLGPETQGVVKAMVALHPALTAIRKDVQETFWFEMSTNIKALGERYLPLFHSELAATASVFNQIMNSISGMLLSRAAFEGIRATLNNVYRAFQNASSSISYFLHAMGLITQVGSTFLPGLGQGLTNLAATFDSFITRIAGDGTLHDWIQAGIDTLKLLMPLLRDVWNIIHPIIRALTESGGGGLGILGTALHALAEFLNSATGMELIATVIEVLNTLFTVFGNVLAALLPSLAQLIVSLGPVLVSLLVALEPSLIELANAIAVVVGWITPFLPQLEKLAPVITVLSQAILGLLVPAIIAWTVNMTAAAIANIAATWEILLVIAAVAALGYGIYQLVKHWTTVWNWIKSIAKNVADFFVGIWHWLQRTFDDVWGHIKDAAKAVADFFVGIWNDVTSGIGAALDWIAALPGKVWDYLKSLPGIVRDIMMQFVYNVGYGIGAAIREFFLLPGQVWHMITSLWDTGKRLWLEGLDAIVDFARQLPHRIAVFWDELRHDVASAFDEVRHAVWTALTATWNGIKWLFTDGISKAWGALKGFGKNVWDFLKGLGPMAKNAVVDAAKWLYNAGRDMITGLINGAKSLFSSAWGTIKDFARSLFHGFMDGIQGKSPSRLFMLGGESIVSGLVKGILDNAGAATSAVAGLVGFNGARGLQGPAFAFGNALGGNVGGGGGAPIVLHVHTHTLPGRQGVARRADPAGAAVQAAYRHDGAQLGAERRNQAGQDHRQDPQREAGGDEVDAGTRPEHGGDEAHQAEDQQHQNDRVHVVPVPDAAVTQTRGAR